MSDVELPEPEEVARPILVNREALIASLEGDERIRALREALVEAEDEWLKQVARTFMNSGKPVDQRKVDYTRGYFKGARHWLGARIDVVAPARLQLEAEHEESEPSE